MTFAHILFPVDFSERAVAAAPHVDAMASRFDSEVTLMHVLEPGSSALEDAELAPHDKSHIVSSQQHIRARLASFAKEHLPGIDPGLCAQEGDPAEVITRFAHGHTASLIMMPSHGYGPFRSLLLGSVTAKVLHDTECPVWTGAHLKIRPEDNHLPCRTIVCALDLGPRSVSLMQWAAQLAQVFGAGLRFVHAVPRIEAWGERQFDGSYEEELRSTAREKLACLQTEAGTAAPACVAVGNASGVVEEEAHRHGADLVVIGRGRIVEKMGRLRTHSHGIIRQAPCPVLSI